MVALPSASVETSTVIDVCSCCVSVFCVWVETLTILSSLVIKDTVSSQPALMTTRSFWICPFWLKLMLSGWISRKVQVLLSDSSSEVLPRISALSTLLSPGQRPLTSPMK